MALPGVKIQFKNGLLGGVANTDDNFFLMCFLDSTAMDTKVIASAQELPNDVDVTIKTIVEDFYNQAGDGARLAVKCIAANITALTALTVADVFDKYPITGAFFINGNNNATTSSTIIAEKINNVAKSILSTYENPIFTMSNAVTEEAAVDLKGLGFERASIVVGNFVDTIEGSVALGRSIIGLVAGRLAAFNIAIKLSKVANGALTAQELMLPGADVAGISIATSTNLFEKGYIVPRTIVGKTGYYIADDLMCVSDSNDYKFLVWRRTIDKAYKVAYNTLINHLNEEIAITTKGTIIPATAKAWEVEVVSALYNTMTVNGLLSVDTTNNNDRGAKCYIDFNQNIVANGKIAATISVKPFGYAQYIDVQLGFLVEG